MRGLARQMRRNAGETADSYYRRMLQSSALELEGAAESLERAGWVASSHLKSLH